MQAARDHGDDHAGADKLDVADLVEERFIGSVPTFMVTARVVGVRELA